MVLLAGVALSACGDDRAHQAQQTVQSYWSDIDHGKMEDAYKLLTSANQQQIGSVNYQRNMLSFVAQMSGISAKTGNAYVNGDRAVVDLTLLSPSVQTPLYACQHLFWESGWKISDDSGTVQRRKKSQSCKGM